MEGRQTNSRERRSTNTMREVIKKDLEFNDLDKNMIFNIIL